MMIIAGVGKTSDPRNLPHQNLTLHNIYYFQIFNETDGVVHNHPSGDPTPSRADIDMTRTIVETAKPLGISVHDHIIIGKAGHASLKGLRLI